MGDSLSHLDDHIKARQMFKVLHDLAPVRLSRNSLFALSQQLSSKQC